MKVVETFELPELFHRALAHNLGKQLVTKQDVHLWLQRVVDATAQELVAELPTEMTNVARRLRRRERGARAEGNFEMANQYREMADVYEEGRTPTHCELPYDGPPKIRPLAVLPPKGRKR